MHCVFLFSLPKSCPYNLCSECVGKNQHSLESDFVLLVLQACFITMAQKHMAHWIHNFKIFFSWIDLKPTKRTPIKISNFWHHQKQLACKTCSSSSLTKDCKHFLTETRNQVVAPAVVSLSLVDYLTHPIHSTTHYTPILCPSNIAEVRKCKECKLDSVHSWEILMVRQRIKYHTSTPPTIHHIPH